MVNWLSARIVAALLWPLHNLAKTLVYKKIHSAIGISKVLYLTPCACFCVTLIILVRVLSVKGVSLTPMLITDIFGEFCGNLQAGISGGGSLPMHVDKFFEVDVYHLINLFC